MKRGRLMRVTEKLKHIKEKIKNKYLSPRFLGLFLWKLLRFILLVGLGFMILYPFLIKIIASIMTPKDLVDTTVKYIPRNLSIQFILRAIQSMNYWDTLKNTFILSSIIGVAQLIVSTIVAYGFARFKFKGKGLIFSLVMLTLLIPPQTTFIPLFLRFKYFDLGLIQFNLLNTFLPLVLLSLTGLGMKNGLYIFMMRQFFRGLPKELEEAAYIDGAGPLKTFFLIILPNAKNMMVTIFLFSFTWQWTENIYTPMFLPDVNVLSRMVGIATSQVEDPIVLAALSNTACLLAIIPLIILYVFAQKFFVESVERSGIVG